MWGSRYVASPNNIKPYSRERTSQIVERDGEADVAIRSWANRDSELAEMDAMFRRDRSEGIVSRGPLEADYKIVHQFLGEGFAGVGQSLLVGQDIW